MLVLIATDAAHPPADPYPAVAGELVTPVVLECADLACDTCARSWFGLASHGAATAAMVVDRPGVDEAALRARLHDWLDAQGAVDAIVQAAEAEGCDPDGVPFDDPVAAVADLIDAHLAEIEAICRAFPVGTVVGRLGALVAPHRLDMVA